MGAQNSGFIISNICRGIHDRGYQCIDMKLGLLVKRHQHDPLFSSTTSNKIEWELDLGTK